MTIRNFHIGHFVMGGTTRNWTRTIDLPIPTTLRASVALGQVMCGPGGYIKVGILSCRFRNEFNEEEMDRFGSFGQWPLTVVEISPTELRSDTDYKLNLKLGRLEPIKQSLPRKTTRKAKPSRSTRGVRTRRSRTGKKR